MPVHPARFFIVKHDRNSFRVRPGVVWRTGVPKDQPPKDFMRVEEGDFWIEFAYVEDEIGYKPCSEIFGFYRCSEPMAYEPIPPAALAIAHPYTDAWTIKGIPYREQPTKPVTVPPIDELLDRKHYSRQTFVPLSNEAEFEHIRAEVLRLQLTQGPTKEKRADEGTSDAIQGDIRYRPYRRGHTEVTG